MAKYIDDTIGDLIDEIDDLEAGLKAGGSTDDTLRSHGKILKAILRLTQENLQQTIRINGSVRQTIARVDMLEKQPSLIRYIHKNPKLALLWFIAMVMFLTTLAEFRLAHQFLEWIGMFF